MEIVLVAEEEDGGDGDSRDEAAEHCVAGKGKLDIIAVSPDPGRETFYRAMTRQFAQKVGYRVPPLTWFQPSSLPKFPKRCKTVHASNLKKKKKKMDTDMFERYLEHLWKNFSKDKRNSCTYLDCLWFSLYKKQSDKVLMWIRRKDIFSPTYVFIPIVCWRHWSLLICCHFGEDLQSETRTPCMLLLDSLEMANPKRLEPDIRRFVLDIFRSEGREEKEELISKIPLLVPKVPQQTNDEDCGIYVLYYIKLFLKSAPGSFNIFEGYPYFMDKNWFDRKALEKFHKQIRLSRRRRKRYR